MVLFVVLDLLGKVVGMIIYMNVDFVYKWVEIGLIWYWLLV